MNHLIYEARMLAIEIRDTKKKAKHVDLLCLHVHKDNEPARKVYERFEFEKLSGFEENNLHMMFHKLDLSQED